MDAPPEIPPLMPGSGNTLSLFRQAEQGWPPCIAYDGFMFYISPTVSGAAGGNPLGSLYGNGVRAAKKLPKRLPLVRCAVKQPKNN
jgi:hypothetical protein